MYIAYYELNWNKLITRTVVKNYRVRLYVRGGSLLICGKYLYGRIILLRGGNLAHKTSLTPIVFIEVPVPCQEHVLSCIFCAKVIDFAFFLTIFLLGLELFWKFSNFFFFHSINMFFLETNIVPHLCLSKRWFLTIILLEFFLLFALLANIITQGGKDIAFANYTPTWKLHRKIAGKALRQVFVLWQVFILWQIFIYRQVLVLLQIFILRHVVALW